MRFPGKDLIFAFIIASLWLSGAICADPRLCILRPAGLDQYIPTLIIPSLVVPFGIFTLTQFFKSIERARGGHAFIDGASRFRTYWTVALPLYARR